MNIVSKFPYVDVQFTKEGQVFDRKEEEQLLKVIQDEGVTDLIVISHGWNNDSDYARALYKRLLDDHLHGLLDSSSPDLAGRKFAVLGILWPSIKFADDDVIVGGGASLGDEASRLAEKIKDLRAALTDAEDQALLEKLELAVDELEADEGQQEEFVQLNAQLVNRHPTSEQQDDGSEVLSRAGREALQKLRAGDVAAADPEAGGAAGLGGGAAGLGSFFSSITESATQLLNYTTYYRMKERAGVVGEQGVAPLLQRVVQKFPALKLHLVGHSFGGRLVTAAASKMPDGGQNVRTLMLLQAAFSHNGFAKEFHGTRNGFFRAVVTGEKVGGPILITHTRNDKAVGVAYAVASRISGVDASALGDKNDRYGGIGSNGAQKTPESDDSLKLHDQNFYDFKRGKLYNLLADAFISGHSDITNRAVANALRHALRLQ